MTKTYCDVCQAEIKQLGNYVNFPIALDLFIESTNIRGEAEAW